MTYEVTERQVWRDYIQYTKDGHKFVADIVVEISDLATGWHIRLVVNGDAGPWRGGGASSDLYYHAGYCWASAFWDLCKGMPIEIPFRAVRTERVS